MNKCWGVSPICPRILAEDYRQEAHKYLEVVVGGGGGGYQACHVLVQQRCAFKNANPPLGFCQLTIKDAVWSGFGEKMRTALLTAGTDLVFTQWMWADYKAG